MSKARVNDHRLQSLENKVIFITGASGGIGYALSIACAKAGATVLIHGRNNQKLNTLYDEIVSHGWVKPVIVPLDFTKLNAEILLELREYIQKQFNHLDALIHTAASLGSLTPIEHYPMQQWLEVMNINLNAAFFITQQLLPCLKHSHPASIIFTAAATHQAQQAYQGAYGISKIGIQTLSTILTKELMHSNINVACVNPIAVDTRLHRNCYPGKSHHDTPKPEQIVAEYLRILEAACNLDSQSKRQR